jgi:hypothetical protein
VAVDITKKLLCEVLKEFGVVRSTCRYRISSVIDITLGNLSTEPWKRITVRLSSAKGEIF